MRLEILKVFISVLDLDEVSELVSPVRGGLYRL